MNASFSRPIRKLFRPTPDLANWFPAVSHENARQELGQAWEYGEGIALLDGEPGLGKTLVAIKFLEDCKTTARRILLPSSRFTTAAELYRTILFDLDISPTDTSETAVRLAVMDNLLRTAVEGSKTVLVLDEAQHLSPWLLEELRLLDNLESKTGKVLFTVLVGLPELRDHIRGSLAQRISTRPQLQPFTHAESLEYLQQHLTTLKLWDEEGAEILAEAAHGVPRLLNQLAMAAVAVAEGAVDVEAAMVALDRFSLVAHMGESEQTEAPLKSLGENVATPTYPTQPDSPKLTKLKKRRSA